MSLFLLWMTHLFIDFLLGIWPIYKTIAGLNLALAGTMASIAALIGESSQIIFGFLADNKGQKPFIIFGLICASTILLVPYTQSYFILLFCLIMLYIGSGAYHPSAAGLASVMKTNQRGFMMTLFSSGGQMGLAISQIFFVWAYMQLGGHTLALAIPIFICLALFYNFQKHQNKQTEIKKLSLNSLIAPFKNSKKEIITLYFCQVSNQVAIYSLIFLLPELLTMKKFSQFLILGGGHFFLIAGSGSCMLLAGFLSDKLGAKRIIVFCSIVALIGYYLFLQLSINSFLFGIISLFILGGFLGSLNPLLVSVGHKIYPNNIGVVSAILMGFAWCLATSSFALSGLLANKIGAHLALQIMGLFNIIPLCLFYFAGFPSIDKSPLLLEKNQ